MTAKTNQARYLTRRELAEYMGVSYRLAGYHMQRLPCINRGTSAANPRYVVDARDVDRYMEERKQIPAEQAKQQMAAQKRQKRQQNLLYMEGLIDESGRMDEAVAEIVTGMIRRPDFASLMRQKINMEVDTSAIQEEIDHYERLLRQQYGTKSRLIDEIDSLDFDDRHYDAKRADLDERLARMYDKIDDTEQALINARAKKQTIEAEKITADNIYRILANFEQLYAVMNEAERHELFAELISSIEVYPEPQSNGQWLKSIDFRLPLVEGKIEWSLDKDSGVETAVFLIR